MTEKERTLFDGLFLFYLQAARGAMQDNIQNALKAIMSLAEFLNSAAHGENADKGPTTIRGCKACKLG